MEQCKIDFTLIPWEMTADGIRVKVYKQNKMSEILRAYGYEITEEKPIWYVIEKELGREINIPCIDHLKFGMNEKEIVLVSEPYDVDMKKIKGLIKFCEIRGL